MIKDIITINSFYQYVSHNSHTKKVSIIPYKVLLDTFIRVCYIS